MGDQKGGCCWCWFLLLHFRKWNKVSIKNLFVTPRCYFLVFSVFPRVSLLVAGRVEPLFEFIYLFLFLLAAGLELLRLVVGAPIWSSQAHLLGLVLPELPSNARHRWFPLFLIRCLWHCVRQGLSVDVRILWRTLLRCHNHQLLDIEGISLLLLQTLSLTPQLCPFS